MAAFVAFLSAMRKERDQWTPDAAIARIAANQHGVVSTAQIRSIGLSPAGVARRVSAGRLHPIHRGVYAVGHARLSNRGRWIAAVLACGPGAVLSHLSASELWGIRRRPRRLLEAGGGGAVHITVPSTAGKRRRNGIVLHRSSTLAASECTRRDGIPVTTPARTLRDVHPLLSPAQFNAALREAEFLRLPIDEARSADRARSELEDRFLALCRRHRLPKPEVNAHLDRFEVDFLWRDAHLVAELDGWESHRTRSAFEEDRARDARLKLLGYDIVRFTWQVDQEASDVAKTIRTLLVRR
jgi:very-short-patch-repair endonuclease